MSDRGRFSIDELKRIGWRIKSVRSLTGLNQEEFSFKSDIPYMTLKGWELGRALPRQDGMRRILLGLEVHGIQVSPEWIIFGDGNGPVYVSANKGNDIKGELHCGETLTSAFKSEQRKKGANPIIVQVIDGLMSPQFNIGDVIGGVVIAVKEMRSIYSPEEIGARSWLIPFGSNEWIVRNIVFNGESLYVKQVKNADIIRSDISSIGKVIWHYFAGEQTYMT
jgi:transcriptional regulator with XRE-family HTH domain